MPVTLIGESVFARCLSSLKKKGRKQAPFSMDQRRQSMKETRKSLLKQSVRPCMPVRLYPMHKGSCCSGRLPRSLDGTSIMVELLSCGGVVASSGPGFLEISRLHLTTIQLLIIYSWMISLGMQSMPTRKVGEGLWQKLWSLVSQHLAFPQLWLTMMDTGAKSYLPT